MALNTHKKITFKIPFLIHHFIPLKPLNIMCPTNMMSKELV